MKKLIAGIALLACTSSASAHDFWLQPRIFQVKPGVPLPITIQVGHGGDRQRWGNGIDRVVMLADVGPKGRTDIRSAFQEGDGPADILPRFTTPGLHILAMQTTHAVSELPAIRFNDYAKVEGLTPAINARARANKSATPGREIYSRRAKALIQVGSTIGQGPSHATRPVGFDLEIVPERDPYALGRDKNLPVHVIFQGRRLAGATVKLTSLEFDAKPIAVVVTDKAGRASFTIPQTGEWLLNVVWTKPITGDRRGDFDTIFSSLTFGYDPAIRPR